MHGIRRLAALAAGAAVVTVACTDGGGPDDPPTSPSRTDPTPTALGSPPPVPDPRDVRPFVGRVCALLSPEQLDELGFPQPEEDGFQGFPPLEQAEQICVWDDKDERTGQLVVWVYPDTNMLAVDYRGDGEYHEIVREVTIGGYPALLRVTSPGSRTCKITVGIAPDQGIRVQYQEIRRTETDICGLATAAAEGVVVNLQPPPPS